MKLPDLLSHALTRDPQRACVVAGERRLTFAEVDERAGRLASALIEVGAGDGERVALLALNEPEYFEIQVAAQRARAIVVPLNYRLAPAELRAILADCSPAVLLHDADHADVAAQLDVPISWRLGPGGEYEDALAAADPRPARTLDADVPSAIIYTSGTTGRAKGAVISNGCLWARLNLYGIELSIGAGDSFLFPIPLFHTSAAVAYAFTYVGATVVVLPEFEAIAAIAAMSTERTSHAVYVPTMLQRVVEELSRCPADLAALRLVLYGGSPIAPDLLRRAMATLDCAFVQGYGLTEALNVTMLRAREHDPDGRPELLPSAGTDAVSYETRIVDSAGQALGPGEVGEIVVRGPGVMDRYWNAPEATGQVLREGWLHTGDAGYRSADGYLFITDRLKDVIVTGGENVYSREVEDALCCHPGVREAVVVGVPSTRWGESVHAEVVPTPGAELDPDEVIAHCRSRLAGYKTPKSVAVVDELPKNASGKILKREIREKYWVGAERNVG